MSVTCMRTDISRHVVSLTRVGQDSTKKSRKSTKIGTKVVRATADIPHHFQGQKVKGQGHQAALGGC